MYLVMYKDEAHRDEPIYLADTIENANKWVDRQSEDIIANSWYIELYVNTKIDHESFFNA